MLVLDLLFGIAAFLVGAALLFAAAPFYLITSGMSWIAKERLARPTVSGTVFESAIRSNRRANGLPRHRYMVRYRYDVNRKKYESQLVAAAAFPYGSEVWATRRESGYPVGHPVTVHYNPADPHTAVLEPGWSRECWYFVAATAMLLIFGTAAVIWGSVHIWNAVA